MNIRKLLFALTMSAALSINAANTTTTVSQVSKSVELSTNVDYVITDKSKPFTTTGSVNIVNSDHAVLILKYIKPSKVISSYLSYIYINGVKAKNGDNCQVKMYGNGAIVMPYDKNIKPLTVYSEPNFQGTSVNSFGLENSGGFMNTLSDAKLNNKIRSFKLKRGYMVTFALGPSGWGYSRCFIADAEDLELANMPANMDSRISSYRVFVWYDAKKSGLASNGDKTANAAVNSSWCYDWAQGNASLLPDVEWVPNHIYEDWPSPATCGGVTGSCHMKTNNEPGNSADDHPQDVSTVLANWQNLMRTGMRLCSETSHDGSMGHLKAFCDSIDAYGWRCDILDLHCYWASGSFNNLTSYSDNYGNGRPIWISEWVWGASWNNNGIFSAAPDGRDSFSTANQQACYDGTVPILKILNSNSRVERYAYWNGEANASKIYRNGTLSLLGEYYAAMEPGIGYKKSQEFIPKVVYKKATNFTYSADVESGSIALSWNDDNGDMLSSMEVQFKSLNGNADFKTLESIPLKEKNSKNPNKYSYTATGLSKGIYSFRIANVAADKSSTVYTDELIISVGGESGYLYNEEAHRFLQAGNDWGTQAVLGNTGQSMIATIGDGKAAFYTAISNGGSNAFLGSNGYVDSECFNWTANLVETSDRGNVYTLANGNRYLGYDGSNIVSLSLTNPSANSARWRFITQQQRDEQLMQATPESPVYATYKISCPDYGRNQVSSAWINPGVIGGEVTNLCMEKYNTTFDTYQVLTNMPAGRYRLTCQGFYRYGTSNTNTTRNAYMYVNSISTPLLSITAENGNLPNNMTSTSQAFSAGKYADNTIDFTLEGSTLKIGIRKTAAVTNDWTIWDNFQLIYYGPTESQAALTKDVTDTYLKNAGFDDSSCWKSANYAPSGTGNNADVTGWTHGVYGWSSSASFKFGAGDFINGSAVPAKDANGASAGGGLALSGGWSGEPMYNQKVTLPAGDYRLEYAACNTGSATTIQENRIGYSFNGTTCYASNTTFATNKWVTESLTFHLDATTEVTFSVGLQVWQSISTDNIKLFIDYVKLYTAEEPVVEPEEPTEPDEPVVDPEEPTEPDEPIVEPEVPTKPEEPTEPDEPIVEPEEPSEPEEPTEPDEPIVEPEEPSEPEEPTEPEVPIINPEEEDYVDPSLIEIA